MLDDKSIDHSSMLFLAAVVLTPALRRRIRNRDMSQCQGEPKLLVRPNTFLWSHAGVLTNVFHQSEIFSLEKNVQNLRLRKLLTMSSVRPVMQQNSGTRAISFAALVSKGLKCRKSLTIFAGFANQERLRRISDVNLILALHVLDDSDHLTLVIKLHLRVTFEIHPCDFVRLKNLSM